MTVKEYLKEIQRQVPVYYIGINKDFDRETTFDESIKMDYPTLCSLRESKLIAAIETKTATFIVFKKETGFNIWVD